MHICYITAEYPIRNLPHGGVGTFTKNLSQKLVESSIAVSVIRLSKVIKSEVIDDNGVKVYLIPEAGKAPLRFLWNSVRISKAVAQIHRKQPISIVETPELGLAFLKKLRGVKYVIRMHGGHHFFAKAENRTAETRKVWQEKRSFAKADAIVAVSEYVAETTRTLLQLGDIKIVVIYNPVNTKRFFQSDSQRMEKHTIFFAGTIIEKKGIRQLIQSLEFLVDDYPDIKLKIAGRDSNISGTTKPYRPVLMQAISDKIRPHIEFLGTLLNTEIPEYIEKAQICCYPSHMEAMPLAWLEVLAMGKPFLGSHTGPGPEAVLDGETGYLTDPFDPKAIAEKIRFIFENYDTAIKIGVNARDRVIKKFDIAILVEKNVEFYKSLMQS